MILLCVAAWAAPLTTPSIALADPGRAVVINALGYGQQLGKAVGGCGPVDIWFARHAEQGFEIAFVEDEIDGYGDSFRAAAWQAALIAADLSGRDPDGIRFFLKRSGRVDGPSAGAITTAGMIAALRGESVRADVAMTGTINPDGTVGPVGGIPHKIDGAAAAGMKLVLIPYGIRNGWDSNLEQEVDLFERGAKQGVEVRSVGDIYTAYRILTGKELPRPSRAPVPELSNDRYRRVKLKIEEWLVRYRDELTEYNEVHERYHSDYTEELVESSAEMVREIDALLAEGQAPAAYINAYYAAYQLGSASQISRVQWVDAQRGRKEAIKYAARFAQIDAKLRVAAEKLRVQQPKTLGEAGTTIYGYTTLTEAICYRDLGNFLIQGGLEIPLLFEVEDDKEKQLEQILIGVEYMQVAAFDCLLVADTLDMADAIEGRAMPRNPPLEATTDFFRRAASANLNQYEKVVVKEKADEAGLSLAKVKWRAMLDEENYLVANWGVGPARQKLHEMFEGEQLAYARLGLAIQTYSLSSSLLAEGYSLRAQYDDQGMLTGVRRPASLKYTLDFADDQARRNVQMLRDAGVDPSEVIFNYQAASVLRSGEDWERLDALKWLWESNMIARTIAHLGGIAGDGTERTAPDAPSTEQPATE